MRQIIVSLLALASCGTVDFASMDAKEFGSSPTVQALQTSADQNLKNTLIDPESLRVRWFDQQPKQAALWTGIINNGWVYGWAMRFGVNAKNRMGGYVGEKPYFVMHANGLAYTSEVGGNNNFQVNDQPAAPAK